MVFLCFLYLMAFSSFIFCIMDSYCQKERKLEQKQDGIDFISNLPDSILGKILSFLPTKYAVGTLILSKRWKYVFPFGIPPIKLDLDDSLLFSFYGKSYDRFDTFVDFVDKLFNSTLIDVPCVETIKLHCKEYFGDEKTVSWVCAALRLKVRELSLNFSLKQSEVLFGCLNGCTTLTRLELGYGYRVRIPDGFTLPNLKVLLLSRLVFYWEVHDMFGKLLSGSPEIEDLCLSHCEFKDWVLGIVVRSPVLKKFTVNRCGMDIELDAPNLEVLQSSDFIRIQSSVTSLFAAHIGTSLSKKEIDELAVVDNEEGPLVAHGDDEDLINAHGGGDIPNIAHADGEDPINAQEGVEGLLYAHYVNGNDEGPHEVAVAVVHGHEEGPHEAAVVHGHEEGSHDVAVLLSSCSSTVHLYLASSSILALQLSREQLLTFQHLTSLALGCVLRSGGWALLARLLLLTPNLEKLTFEEGFSKYEGGYSRFESLLPNPPLCLDLNLREIKFMVFKEEDDELKLVEYFLRNGKVIQKLKINCLPFQEKKISRLFMLPKFSKVDFQPR